jgi:hypothetical protein
MKNTVLVLVLFGALAAFGNLAAAPFGEGFTYQGRLMTNGGPAQGLFDFQFVLFPLASGGSGLAGPLTKENVPVTNGLLTVTLDFGSSYDGDARWLEIAVRDGDSTGPFTTLTPRQELTPAPHALYAKTAAQATMANSAASVNWTDIVGLPSGFADGVDSDHLYTAGSGLTLSGESQFQVAFGVSGIADLAARADHNHVDAAWIGDLPTGYVLGLFNNGVDGIGVHGQANATTGHGTGVQGESKAENGRGVAGYANGTGAEKSGVYGYGATSGYGVRGYHSGTTEAGAGVYGHTVSANATAAGVLGESRGSGDFTAGVRGRNIASGPGVEGLNESTGTGVFGQSLMGIGVSGAAGGSAPAVLGQYFGSGPSAGVLGVSGSAADYAVGVRGILLPYTGGEGGLRSAAVAGQHQGTGVSGTGVWGEHLHGGTGVYGSSQTGTGVEGVSSSGTGVYGGGEIGVRATTTPTGTAVSALGAGPASTALSINNGAIRVVQAGVGSDTPVFIHRATSANTAPGSHITRINHPLTDVAPNAILILTHNYSQDVASNGYETHPVGVYYDGSRWNIYHEDLAEMPVGRAFNVIIIKP